MAPFFFVLGREFSKNRNKTIILAFWQLFDCMLYKVKNGYDNTNSRRDERSRFYFNENHDKGVHSMEKEIEYESEF